MRDKTVGKIILKIDNEFEVLNLDLSNIFKFVNNNFDADIMHFATSKEKAIYKSIKSSLFNIYISPTYLSVISKHNEPMMAIEFEGDLNQDILDIASILLKLHYYYGDIKKNDALLEKILQTVNERNMYYVNNAKTTKKAVATLIKLIADIQSNKIEEIKLTPTGDIITSPPILQTNEEWFSNAIIYDHAEKLPSIKEKKYILHKNQLSEITEEIKE